MPESRKPIGDVLPDITIHPLDEGDDVVTAFVLVKVRAADGSEGWSFRTSEPPNREELLGALTVQVDLLRQSLADDWTTD